MGVEIAEAYVSLVPSLEGFAAKVASDLNAPLQQTGEDAGKTVSEGMFSGLGGKAATAGIAVGVGLGAGVAAAGAGLFALGSTFDDAFDQIRVQTGATGDTLGSLTDSFKTVFSDVPASSGDAATAIGTLNQKLGLTGAPLEGLSEQILNLSHITGTDLNANLKAAVDVFNSFGISAADQPAKLDELFRASQATGVSVDQLASQMASAGPNLQQLGFSFEQSAGLLGIFGKAGVDAGAVLPALSKSIVAAAKDGKNAGDVFKDTFNAIKNAPDDTSAAGAAIDVFGAKAGPKLAGLIRQGKLGYDELAQSIAAGGDTINGAAGDTADLSEKFGTFKNQVLVGLEPIASGVFSAIGDGFERLAVVAGPVIATVTQALTGFFNTFQAGDGEVTDSGLSGTFERIAVVARQLWDAIAGIDFGAIFGKAKDLIEPVISNLKDLFTTAVGIIQGIDFGAVFQKLQDIAAPIIENVAGLLTGWYTLLTSALDTVFKLISDNKETIATVADIVGNVLAKGAQAAGTAIGALGDVFRFLADHMDAVKAIVIPLVAAWAAYELVMGTIAVVTGVVSAATAIWTGIQAAFNVVMALNPIGIVVAAIAALVVGVIYAYTHFDTFRGIIDGVWQVMQTVFHWITDHWPLLLAIILGPFGVAILAVVKNFDTIKGAIEGVFNWIVDHWQLLLAILTGPIGLAVLAIVTFWDQIKDAFTTVKDWIGERIGEIVGFFAGLPGQVWSFIDGLYQQIKDGITAVKDWIFSMVEQIVSFYVGIPGRVLGVLLDLYTQINNGITAVKDWIFGRVEDIVSFYIGIPGRVWGVISGLYETLKAGFTGVRDWIGQKVDDVVNFFIGLPGRVASAVSGLAGQLLQVGTDMGRSLLSGLASALSTGLDFAGSIVGDIAGALRGAINGVIDLLNNAIPNKLGIGPLSIDLPDNPIPHLAKGGIVTRPTLAIIGEAGPEAVVPLGGSGGARAGLGGIGGGPFRDLIINPRTEADAVQIAREVRWAQLTAGV